MEKLEILDILSIIRIEGCCNMLDRNCIVQRLISAKEYKAVKYLQNLEPGEFFSLVAEDLADYIDDQNNE